MLLPTPKGLLALILTAAAVFMTAVAPAHAQDFPQLTGRVVDQANLLSPAQEAELTNKLDALETQSNRQFVVATVNSLDGYDIESYGYQLGRTWAIGQDGDGETEKDNGIILLVAPNERKVRIEVGYGLEGIMTDALSSIIIQNDILPQFRDNNMAGGILAGADRVMMQLALPEEEARALAADAEQRSKRDGGSAGLAVFWMFILIFFVLIPMFSARKGRRYRGGAGPVIIWGGGSGWGSGGGGFGSGGGGFGGGGFGGGGGSFGGGGASGGW